MKITNAQALAFGRRECVLNLWADGKTIPEIADRVTGLDEDAVKGYIRRGRKDGDTRAARRNEGCISASSGEGKSPDSRKEKVLTLWARGRSHRAIAEELGVSAVTVCNDINRAWIFDQDERARPRNSKSPCEPRADVEKDAKAQEPRAVSLPVVRFIGSPESLRPLALSIARETSTPRGALTASLCGDPPPERSALGRECRPEEYASKGEGRYRDYSFRWIPVTA